VTSVTESNLLTAPGRLRLVRVMANGQPALAIYQLEPDGAYHAHAVLMPTVTRTGIARMVSFVSPELFGLFGLPQKYRAVDLMPARDPGISSWAG
jgi:RNA polymerase sigma-70 factor (ECF subfamily)